VRARVCLCIVRACLRVAAAHVCRLRSCACVCLCLGPALCKGWWPGRRCRAGSATSGGTSSCASVRAFAHARTRGHVLTGTQWRARMHRHVHARTHSHAHARHAPPGTDGWSRRTRLLTLVRVRLGGRATGRAGGWKGGRTRARACRRVDVFQRDGRPRRSAVPLAPPEPCPTPQYR
jgi:hypothetical protein